MSRGVGRRDRNDRGWVTVWTVALSVALVAIVGFTLNAGKVLRARSDAFGTAAAAARRGVQEIDERIEVAEGRTVLDEDAARAAALQYVHERGYTGEVAVNGLEVTVTVHGIVHTNMPGVGNLDIESRATAEAVQVGP